MAGNKKWLVLGNAPCLIKELEGVDIDKFDTIVRVNCWHPIPGQTDRCDLWVCYAPHHIGHENRFDVIEHSKKADMIGNAWEFSNEAFKEILGREPDLLLTAERAKVYLDFIEAPVQPTAGTYALFMAIEFSGWQGSTADVYVAGFDFFKNADKTGQLHYYSGEGSKDLWKKRVRFHDPSFEAERSFYERFIKQDLFLHVKGKEWYEKNI